MRPPEAAQSILALSPSRAATRLATISNGKKGASQATLARVFTSTTLSGRPVHAGEDPGQRPPKSRNQPKAAGQRSETTLDWR